MEYRVSGPPGTGKTTWLGEQVRRALASGKYSPGEIYVVSFTRAAAQEVAGRHLPIPKANIGTIHALCYRSIGSPRIAEKDKNLVDEWNSTRPKGNPRWMIDGGKMTVQDGFFENSSDTLLAKYSLARSLQTNGAALSSDLIGFVTEWEKFKNEYDAMDFTDLLIKAPDALPDAKVLFVDEAQDLSPLQWKVVRQWGSQCEQFIVVGDDDQLLYSFAGARPESFLIDLPSEQIRVLNRSYRLPSEVHAYSTRWIKRIKGKRQEKEFAPDRDGGSVHRSSVTYADPMKLITPIKADLAEGRSVMVLATCAFMLRPFLQSLRQFALPFHNPYRVTDGMWNPLAKGTTSARLMSLWNLREDMNDRSTGEHIENPANWRNVAELFGAEDCFKTGMKCHVKEMGIGTGKVGWGEIERHFDSPLLRAIKGWDLHFIYAHFTPTARKAVEYPLKALRLHGTAALTEEPKIIVGTIHSVKGGQADSVYLFPDYSMAAAKEIEERKQAAIDDLIRCFYVGITRSRDKLTLCEPSKRFFVQWI
jgi:DNA helicase II / ATP-dependent DNA helicase PcrA